MNTAGTIVSVNSNWFNDFTLTFSRNHRAFLNFDVDLDEVFDTDELIEAQPLFFHHRLVVLLDSSSISGLDRHTKRRQLLVLSLLNLKLRDNERELCELWLTFLLDGDSHALKHSRLMQLVSVDLTCLNLFFLLDLWVEVRMSVTVELPNINSIILCS